MVFDLLFSWQRSFPYVSVMLGNGTLSYDHDRDGRPTELGGCTALVRNALYDTFLLIRYSGNRLRVRESFTMYMFRFLQLQSLPHLVAKTRNCSSEKEVQCFLTVFFLNIFFTVVKLMVNVDWKQEWKECADITGLRLPIGYFFGASSATGDLSGMTQHLSGSNICRFREKH